MFCEFDSCHKIVTSPRLSQDCPKIVIRSFVNLGPAGLDLGLTKLVLFTSLYVCEVRMSSLGGPCESSGQCLPTNSVCSSQRACTCASGFSQHGSNCGKSSLQLVIKMSTREDNYFTRIK